MGIVYGGGQGSSIGCERHWVHAWGQAPGGRRDDTGSFGPTYNELAGRCICRGSRSSAQCCATPTPPRPGVECGLGTDKGAVNTEEPPGILDQGWGW
jgi:hypothetical protein